MILMIAVDTIALFLLMEFLTDAEFDLQEAINFMAPTAALGGLLTFVFMRLLGIVGIFLSGFFVGLGLGLAISYFHGVEIKRSVLIGLSLMGVHFVTGICLALVTRIP